MFSNFGRCNSGTSLYSFLKGLQGYQDLFSFYQLAVRPCPDLIDSLVDNDCYVTVYENPSIVAQGSGSRPTRSQISCILEQVEYRVAQYLGYWPYPHYVENEVIQTIGWESTIRTMYSRVVRAGKKTYTKVVDGLPQVVTREHSPFSPQIEDILRITIGDENNPFPCDIDLCNFYIYPQGFDLKDEWRLRPFEIISCEDGVLTIDFPIFIMVDPSKYYVLPDEYGDIRRLPICEDIFIEGVEIYQISYEKPHGYARLAKDYCQSCCSSPDEECSACELPEVPICLEPVNWFDGIFHIKPIINTGTEEEPCWEQASCFQDCCMDLLRGHNVNYGWAYNCYCTTPLDIEIDYVSSCDGSWFEECIPDDSCDELLRPLTDLVLAELPSNCICGCLNERIDYLKQSVYRTSINERLQPLPWSLAEKFLSHGLRQGDLEAFMYLSKYVQKRRPPIFVIE